MRASEIPELRDHYIEHLRSLLPSRTLEHNVIHASECELCPMRHYYTRTLTETPPLTPTSILFFVRGRAFERFISTELPPREKEGIVGTVDGEWNGELVEIKSTTQDMDKFNPLTSQPHWLQRSKAYCYLYDVNVLNLCVWFLVGNMWTHKTEPTGMKTWRLEFTQSEIDFNWGYMLSQREALLRCINEGVAPDESWVKARREYWECKGCQYSLMCPYFNTNGRKK